MKHSLYLFIIVFVLVAAGCHGDKKAVRHLSNLGNTPYQEDTILVTYGTDPDRALMLLDSAVLLGNVNDYHAQMCRAIIFSKALVKKNLDSALVICNDLLKHDSTLSNQDNYEMLVDLLINISRNKSDNNEYLRWSLEKAKICCEHGEETELLRTEAEIGLIMCQIGREEEGMAKLDKAISQLDRPGSVDRMDAFIIAVKRKITILNKQGRPDEVIPLANRVLDRLKHYEQHVKDYAEDSYRLSWSDNPSDRDRYIDFSRAQANGFLAAAYAKTGDKAKARECLARFNQSGYGQTFSARTMIVPAQMALNMYDEVTATYDKQEQCMGNDTLNDAYATLLHNRALIAHQKGRTADAFDLINRYASLIKTSSEEKHITMAHNFAARYHDQEQKLMIQEKENALFRSNIRTVTAIVLSLLILVFAIIAMRQRKILAMKNKVLVQQISNAIEYKKKYEALLQSPEETEASVSVEVPLQSKPVEHELQSVDQLTDSELYQMLCDVIKRDFLYLDPNFDRQKIVDMFHLSTRRVGSAFSQGSDFSNMSDFIRNCRLEYSCALLVNHPELTIKEVASKSGFTYASTYSTDFKNHFTVTPSRYRELRLEKKRASQ